MQTTRYFEDVVLAKRAYLKREWCEEALQKPLEIERQVDGRYRYWIFVPELGKFLRVVTLSDGVTVHNAFPDRDYKG